MQQGSNLSVAIATYRRGRVLVDTIEHILALQPAPFEVLVIDQTETHDPGIAETLRGWQDAGRIRWLLQSPPSITRAMNRALLEARGSAVVFVDDDVIPDPDFLVAHAVAHRNHPRALVAGRVIQPWHEALPQAHLTGLASPAPAAFSEFIGCNFLVPRELALEAGGFDENFVRVAYRYESEFAHRWSARGLPALYEPAACLRHLKAGEGGTRSFGDHLTTWRPDHAVGAYYFALRTGTWREFVRRPAHAAVTRYHLRHPWRVPGTLLAELQGMIWALRLNARGPRTLDRGAPST